MNKRVAYLALVFGLAGAVSVGCGADDDSTPAGNGGGGAGGTAGSAGKAGSAGSAGKAGSSGNAAGSGNESGSAGEVGGPAGSAGTEQGGAGGDHGDTAGSGPGGEGGEAGAGGHKYPQAQIDRGTEIVRGLALCGGCHTATTGTELGGNPAFKGGTLPAPNLTNDPTGIGDWTDAQVITAFRDGIDDEGRHLDPTMPYWLFHNMSDADAQSVVAFLRSSLPLSTVSTGGTNPNSTAVATFPASALPDTTLASTSTDYAAAVQGKYLVSGVAQCVKCHSPSAGTPALPSVDFFSGVPPANNTTIFASNLTPDLTGLNGWTAADVATALKVGTNKAGVTLCGSMPSAGKGYGGMSDADAHAIGVYLTTIAQVSKPSADPGLEPACPTP